MFSGLKKIKLEVNNKDTWKILKCLDIKKCTAKYSTSKKKSSEKLENILIEWKWKQNISNFGGCKLVS